MREISTAVVARRAVEIAVDGPRMKLSVGSIRIAANRHPAAANKNAKHAMSSGRVSSSGDVLCSQNEHSDVVWNFKTLL
jgi:hypothetical protein